MIGITNAFSWYEDGISKLKRDLLFFDKIIISNVLAAKIEFPLGTEEHLHWANELEFLLESGFFVSQVAEYGAHINLARDYTPSQKFLSVELKLEKVAKALQKLQCPKDGILSADQFHKIIKLNRTLNKIETRLTAELLTDLNDIEVISLDGIVDDNSATEVSMSKQAVFNLAIKQVPLPNDQTPWESIFEMANDQDLKSKARRLRLWSRKIASEQYSTSEVKDELQEMIYSYEQATRLHGKNFQYGVLTSTILGFAGLTENLIKLRFTKVAEQLASVKIRKTDLLIEELDRKGREVALIPTLKNAFE